MHRGHDGDANMLTPVVETKSSDAAAPEMAKRLNHGCFCITLDRAALSRQLDAEIGIPGFAAALASSHPSLFSNVPVFVSPETMLAMECVVAAIEAALTNHAEHDDADGHHGMDRHDSADGGVQHAVTGTSFNGAAKRKSD